MPLKEASSEAPMENGMQKILFVWGYIFQVVVSSSPKPILEEGQLRGSKAGNKVSVQSFSSMLQPGVVQLSGQIQVH